MGVVLLTQAVGLLAALGLGLARGEPVPGPSDLGWSLVGGCTGVLGITALYRGLAVGRMGVVAPTTGVMAAVVPVAVGFMTEGVPGAPVIAGIGAALVAVVLVTRSGGRTDGRPSGIRWALVSGAGIGTFNVAIGQLTDAGAFGPLVVIRLTQAVVLCSLILTWRQPWRVPRRLAGRVAVVGLLDMGGNAAFILAAQVGALAIAAVLSSLYPVMTVVLAITILRERLTRGHVAGIALTAVAIALIAGGSATL